VKKIPINEELILARLNEIVRDIEELRYFQEISREESL